MCLWLMAYGLWPMANRLRRLMANRLRRLMAYGSWLMAYRLRRLMAYGLWLMDGTRRIVSLPKEEIGGAEKKK